MAIVNPALSGDLIDFLDQTKLLLTVDATNVDFTTNQFRLDSYNASYSGKTLTFSELTNIASATFTIDDDVELKFNFGSGLVKHFSGKIRQISPAASNNNEQIQYTVFGYQQLCSENTVLNAGGVPILQFGGGSEVVSGNIWGLRVSTALNTLFYYAGSAGVSTSIGSPGLSGCSTYLRSEVSVQNSSFIAAAEQILNSEPGNKMFWNDEQAAWTFPEMFGAPLEVVNVSSINVLELSYTIDCANRFTAIELSTFQEGTGTIPFRGYGECTPAWDGEQKNNWHIGEAGLDNPQVPSTAALFFAYRLFRMPDIIEERNKNAPVKAYAKFIFGGKEKFIPMPAQFDFQNKLMLLNFPAVIKGNRRHKGKFKPADSVMVTWWKIDTFPTSGWPKIRYPEASYTGTAYTKYGITNTKYENVDAQAFHADVAQSKLEPLKDAIISGTLVVEGDPLETFLELNRRIQITGSNDTGITDLDSPVLEYAYEFGQRGKSTITFSTDRGAGGV